MAKQYRKPTNEVTVIYGGRSPAGRDTLNPKDVLPNGMTAKQHCEKLIAERGGKGHFIEKNSELEDVCMLHSCSYFGGCYEAAEYSYHYALCTEIEFTATLNGKATTAKELAALKGGERVIITANQDVSWSANDNKKLEKVAINPTTYSFTMPKTGSFTIKATGKCDPKASKSVTVAVKTATPTKPTNTFNGFGTEMDKYIHEAATKFSMDEKVLRGFIKMEDGWTGKISPTGATGPGQFTEKTWNYVATDKQFNGSAIGMMPVTAQNRNTPNDPRRNLRINTLATALYAQYHAKILKNKGLEASGVNLYLMHNVGQSVTDVLQGKTASPALIKAMQQNNMKTNETPAQFVKRQGDIYMRHYREANDPKFFK